MKWRRGLLFLVVFTIYFGYGITTSFDSRFVIHTAMGLLRHASPRLDTYGAGIDPKDEAIEVVDGHVYSFFPIGTPLMAAPFVAVTDALASRALTFTVHGTTVPFDLEAYMKRGGPIGLERLIAAIVTAATVVVVHAIACATAAPRHRTKVALLAALIFAFATPAWSTASRALWQHGPSMLMLSLTLLTLLRARETPRVVPLAGLCLAFSYVIRPTNSLSIVAITLYVALAHRRYLGQYLLLAALVAVPFFAFNFSIYHAPLSTYYRVQRLALHKDLLAAIATNWIAPSRGILVYSPIFLLSFYGAWTRLKARSALDATLASVIVAHGLVIGMIVPWFGGNSFGPRYFSDMSVYFVFFLVPALDAIAAAGARKTLLVIVTALLVGVSVFIHHRGVTSWAVYDWTMDPVSIADDPWRLWRWHDVQFLRGL